MAYLTLGKASDIPEGDMRAYNVGGYEIAVARVKGSLYAFDNRCTHRQDYMTNGYLGSDRVFCAFHDAEFDLRTGEVLGGPAFEPMPVFATRVEGDEIQVEWPYDLPQDSITVVDHTDDEHRFFTQFLI